MSRWREPWRRALRSKFSPARTQRHRRAQAHGRCECAQTLRYGRIRRPSRCDDPDQAADLCDRYRAQVIAAVAIVFLQAALACPVLERYLRDRATEQAGEARAESGQYRESLAHLVRVHMAVRMSTAIAHQSSSHSRGSRNSTLGARLRLSGLPLVASPRTASRSSHTGVST